MGLESRKGRHFLILIGPIQVTPVLLAARYIFSVPMQGNILLLYGVVLIFITANLTLGITFSGLNSGRSLCSWRWCWGWD
jgi:hypothetical protein